MLLVSLLIGYRSWTHPSPDHAFCVTFGLSVPKTVKDVYVRRYYMGGPGDTCILISFTIDRETLGELLHERSLELDDGMTEFYLACDGNIEVFWASAFGTYVDKSEPVWNPPRLLQPLIYRLPQSAGGAEAIRVVWDELSGRAWVRRLVG